MSHAARRQPGQEGAVLIQVAVSLFVLTAFSAFVIDYGIFWVSRAQAQNAADAGAMAAAVSLAFDDYTNRQTDGPARQAAVATASANRVWLEPPVVGADDVTFPADFVNCPDNGIADDPRVFGGQAPCVRIDVHQTVPTVFATLLGITGQAVRATAMSRFISANATDCLAPLAIADKWTELTTPAKQWYIQPDDLPNLPTYDRYIGANGLLKPGIRDNYGPPSATVAGFGFRNDQQGGPGFQLTLREAPESHDAIKRGQFIAVSLPAVDTTAPNAFQANIESCNGIPIGVGQSMTALTGSQIAPALSGIQHLIDRDPAASWNTTTGKIQNSCAMSTPACASFSPRLMAIPVFDVAEYDRTRWAGMTLNLRMVNVIGFFVQQVSTSPAEIRGYVTWYPGLNNHNAPGIAYAAAFLRTAVLMR